MTSLLAAQKISKIYTDMATPVTVLQDLDFELEEGKAVGIFGASGSGKSTFLHILGGLDRPTSGRVCASDTDIGSLDEGGLARFRNQEIGFVFQFYHLLPELSAMENVMLPPLVAGKSRKQAEEMAQEALSEMGLSDRAAHRPATLSGGEQQRVAIARASVMRPKVLLADEPTGNLDQETGRKVWEYLLSLHRKQGMSIVAVTHNRELIADFTFAYELCEGRLTPLTAPGSC